MIQKIELTASDLELTDDIKKYVDKKIGKLDKYMTKHARKTAHAEVRLKQEKGKKSDRFTADIVLFVPGEQLKAKEATLNIFAAVDIVEAKLRNQLRRYKDKAVDHKSDRKQVLRRLRNIADRDYWGSQN